jgi:hypothetical protein
MLMFKCIVAFTWYSFQTFTQNGSHTSILSYIRSSTNGNLHEWFLSLKYAIRIHTNLESMDATMSLQGKRLHKIMIACTHICRQVHLSGTCTIAPTGAYIDA